jgi:hypothetical protein
VSEQFLDDFYMDAHRQQKRSRAMPQIMKSHRWKADIPEQPFKPCSHGFKVDESAVRTRKNKVIFFPCLPSCASNFFLPCAVMLEHINKKRGKDDLSPARCSLWLAYSQSVA